MGGEMAQMVLVCIFSDVRVLKALELAQLMEPIRGGKAPEGLLTILKRCLGHHMKENAYLYQREIKQEIANIERIQALKTRAIGLAGSLILSALIGLANFVSSYFYEHYVGDVSGK